MRDLWLMRHGAAEPEASGGDEARALTAAGRESATLVGRGLAHLEPRPDAVWHSPLVRAAETAELVKQGLGIKAGSQTFSDLTPFGDARRAAQLLFEAGERRLLVVSHLPVLPRICMELLGSSVRLDVTTSTVVHLRLFGGDGPVGSALLQALFPGEALAALSRSLP